MEEALAALELELKRVCTDLQFASHQIEATREGQSMLSLARRLRHAAQRVEVLERRTGTLVAEREAVAAAACVALMEVQQGVARMALITGTQVDGEEEWADSVQTLRTAVDACPLISKQQSSSIADAGNDALTPSASQQLLGAGTPNVGGEEAGKAPAAVITSSTAPATTTTATAATGLETAALKGGAGVPTITESMFASVAPSVRGRCKLEDVRRVYAALVADHREKKANLPRGIRPPATSRKELDQLGVRVSGHSGMATLNTLRTMGLVTLTRDSVALVVQNRRTKAHKPGADSRSGIPTSRAPLSRLNR